jgi:hypothetical protein
MATNVITIIRKPTAAAWGISWLPAIRAVIKPAMMAPRMVRVTASRKISVGKRRRMAAIRA